MIALFRLLRVPNLILLALMQVLVRYCLVLPLLHQYGYEPALTSLQFTMLVVSFVLLAASGYVINDYFDLNSDKVNKPQSAIVGRKFTRQQVLLLHVVLTIAGVLCGLLLSYTLHKISYAIMYLCAPVLLWYYSAVLKRQGFIGNILASGMFSISAVVVVSAEFVALDNAGYERILTSDVCKQAWNFTLIFAFFLFVVKLIRELVKDMANYNGDAKQKFATLPVEMGIANTKLLVYILILFAFVIQVFFYCIIPQLNNSIDALIYMLLFVNLPLVIIAFCLHKANTQKQYSKISMALRIVLFVVILFIYFAQKLL